MKGNAPGAPAWRQAIPGETDTQRLACLFAQALQAPCSLYLRGDLGAGKTTFVRACVQSLGYPGHVKSPSYGLLETYVAAGFKILHLDLYRIEDPEELEYLALRDLYGSDAVLMVEWPDRGGRWLPWPDLVLEFGETAAGRELCCYPKTDTGRKLAQKVLESL